jgi:hypothetical protein
MKRRVLRALVSFAVLAFAACSLTGYEDALRARNSANDDDVPTCERQQKLCNVEGTLRCVGMDRPGFGCGRSNCIPCSIPHATARCSVDTRVCEKASCQRNWDDCDDDEESGCETHTDTNVEHCGGCNQPCEPVPNAEVRCGGSECYIRVCNDGYRDCNGRVSDGCETPCDGECSKDTCP